jgi:hypothetical protein
VRLADGAAAEDLSMTSPLRPLALVATTFAAAGLLGFMLQPFFPGQQWLFWHYLLAWLLALVFAAACVSAGFATLRLVLRRPLPLAEQLAIAFAIGAFEFFLGMFAGGMLHLYGPLFFVALPLVMLLSGARPLTRYLGRLARLVAHRRRRASPPPLFSYPVVGFGLLGLAMIYLLILTPENTAFDARWQHLGLAEQYASAGGITRSPEGWFVAASPQLVSMLYGWAMLIPGGTLFDRIATATHIEFVGFLFTLVGVSALARRLVRGPRPRHAWVARFLFPGVFLYDSSLSAGADHLTAIFAAPIFLLLLRVWDEPSPRWMALFVTALSAAVLAKYTGALILIGFPILAAGLRVPVAAVRRLLGRPKADLRMALAGIATALVLGLILTAPFWLKNWIWYRDPVYPVLHDKLPVDPWTEDSALRLRRLFESGFWRPERNLGGLLESLKVLLTFSFVPNDWPQFHGKVPVFGSLFTLGLVLLPFLRRTRRIWALYAAVHVGIFAWYWIHHQDRYLQVAMPLIAAGTAAVLTLAWRESWAVKAGVAALVGASIVWGGHAYFIQTHAMIGSPQKALLGLLAKGRKDPKDDPRLRPYQPLERIGRSLPDSAVVLLHETRIRVGLARPALLDYATEQGGLSYGRLKSAREVYARLAEMGVTHLLWHSGKSVGEDSLAGDLVFFHFALFATRQQQRFEWYTLGEMPPEPPDLRFDDRVLVLGCANSEYRPGLYLLNQLTVAPFRFKPPLPKPDPYVEITQDSYRQFVGEVDFLVFDRACHDGSVVAGRSDYVLATKRKTTLELWLRKPSAGSS